MKLQRVHNSMIKAASSFSYILNTLLENMSEDDGTLPLSSENMESLLDKSLQAWSCFGSANFELVAWCREALRSHIASDFGHLCAQKTSYTDFLFGDDVTKQIKDIAEDNHSATTCSGSLVWDEAMEVMAMAEAMSLVVDSEVGAVAIIISSLSKPQGPF